MCYILKKKSINLGSAVHGPLREAHFGSDFTSGCTSSWTPESPQAGHDRSQPRALPLAVSLGTNNPTVPLGSENQFAGWFVGLLFIAMYLGQVLLFNLHLHSVEN